MIVSAFDTPADPHVCQNQISNREIGILASAWSELDEEFIDVGAMSRASGSGNADDKAPGVIRGRSK